MNLWDAFILGIVEGLTEYLPVSSTGHLILASHFLGLGESEADKAFQIVIQGGAILAVCVHYKSYLKSQIQDCLKGNFVFPLKLLCSFIPAAVLGLLFYSKIKEKLFGPVPVIYALIIGGLAMILVERFLKKRTEQEKALERKEFQMPSWKQAWGIGFFQVLSLIPGTSRSMSTLLGARLLGLKTSDAAEYSFLLALPTLLAATAYDFLKNYQAFTEGENMFAALLVGSIVSFFVAWGVIKFFLKLLEKYSLEIFGWYRIVFGFAVYYLLIK